MQGNLHVIGLTGGIATGKSTCAQILCELLPETVLFDADTCVRNLYEDEQVLSMIIEYFGNEVVKADGSIDKSNLRRKAFSCAEDKAVLEEVFHPLVRKECLALLDETLNKRASPLFVADVPLLFENGFDFGQSANLLVATSKETQTDRLIRRNKWDQNTVNSVISSQLAIEAKHDLADVIFWNEGGTDLLRKQCLRYLKGCGIKF